MGNVLTRTDARGKVWTYTYDNLGRLLSQRDPLAHTTTFEYDGVGNKIKETDAEGKIKTFEYDSDNRMTKATDALGNITLLAYDPDGKLIRQTDAEGKITTYEYDIDGRPSKTIDGNGNETTTEYADTTSGTGCSTCSGATGSADQPARTIFPTFSKEYKYDTRGRKIEEKDILSTTESYSTLSTYDATGNVLTQTDKESKVTTFTYDALGRRTKATDPATGNTAYTYDARGNLLSLKDAKGNSTIFEYDRNNRVTKETRPLGQATTYQYNGVGSLVRKIDAKNQKIEYEYDDAGRMTATKYFSVTTDTTPVKTVTFTYSNAGNLTGYNDGTTSATYVYDDAYRKLSETINYGTFELTYSYAYYKNGLKKSLTMPDGTVYEYGYDSSNQISTVMIPGRGVMTYNTYTWNAPSAITLPGGTTKEIVYSPLMQPKTIAVKDPAQNALMTYDYTYSPAGNITKKATEQGEYNYQHDPLYRLKNATNPVASAEAFTYDGVGNRTTSAAVSGTWTYNNNNEMQSSVDATYEYDANGNTTKKTVGSVVTTYTYDIDNRLVRVALNGANVANYCYDVFGRRLWKEVGGSKRHFLYTDDGLVGEYDGTGIEIKTYGYAPDSAWSTNPLFQKIGSDYYWYQNDHLSTPQKITDSSGAVVWSATYDAFGNATVNAGSTITNNLRFPGQYYDAETGLHYNWNRYYDPNIGRYITADPIGLEGGINLFVYAEASPLNWVDPQGLFALVICERCPNGSMQCRSKEDNDNPSEPFQANAGRNDPSLTPGDPYGENGPIPPGQYDLPIAYSPKFGRNLPSPTNTGAPGEILTPKGTKRSGVRVHKGNVSQGCVTTGSGAKGQSREDSLTDLVHRHSKKGGTILIIKEGDCCDKKKEK
jgi:RHS repeat-associated protein